MNGFLDDFKYAWQRPNNALAQLIIINILIFVVLAILKVFSTWFSFEPVFVLIFDQFTLPGQFSDFLMRPWTLITYSFTHSLSYIFHILFNMLVLYWFGRVFVDFIGSQRLINLYVLGALAGGLIFLFAYNVLPFYREMTVHGLIGASASVYAVLVAAATMWPEYRFYLLFFGPVKIKYIAIVLIFISFIGSVGSNAGGNLAHLGGALIGFYYGYQFKQGREIGVFVFHFMEFVKGLFKPKPKIKVTHRTKNFGSKRSSAKQSTKSNKTTSGKDKVSQDEIDAILDKISERGYESLTKEEKEKLFNASK